MPAYLTPDEVKVADLGDPCEFDLLYTPLADALDELHRRRADPVLRDRVAAFHRALPPPFLGPDARAFYLCAIHTPSRECERLLRLVRGTGLVPSLLEYHGHIFASQNRCKRSLCRPLFEMRPDHPRGLRVVNGYGQRDGVCMSGLKTLAGLPLVDFHHALLRAKHPECAPYLRDVSAWLTAARHAEPSYPYLRYLACFISDGILFENFVFDDPEERRFTRERVLPSFHRAVELFGVRPLIVSLLPRESENEDRWRWLLGDLYDLAWKLSRKQPSAQIIQ